MICAKCGSERGEVAFLAKWNDQMVCSCCLHGEPDYWRKRAYEVEAILDDLASRDPVADDGLCVYCDSYKFDHRDDHRMVCPWIKAGKYLSEMEDKI
jgi:hypothetical protein